MELLLNILLTCFLSSYLLNRMYVCFAQCYDKFLEYDFLTLESKNFYKDLATPSPKVQQSSRLAWLINF